jgi:tetratricopeptide (TPR) repeat protein
MPQVSITGRDVPSKTVAVTIVAVVLVIASISAYALWARQQRYEAAKREETLVTAEGQNYDFHQQYGSEQKVLTAFINSNPPKQYKYDPLVQLGAMALEQNQPLQAKKWYMEAEAASGTQQLEDVDGLASVYVMLGNKPEAIIYVRRAIAIDQRIGNADNTDLLQYQQELKLLETNS